jgi:hypothetical protein
MGGRDVEMTTQKVEIVALPNQQVSFNGYNIDLYAFTDAGDLAADVSFNNTVIIQGVHVIIDTPIIPYNYLNPNSNFILSSTTPHDTASYTNLGLTQALYYVSV